MRFSKFNLFFIIGLFICFVTISTAARAQGSPPEFGRKPAMAGMPGGMPGLNGLVPFLKLNLTQSQQKTLLDIFEKYREMRMPVMDTMMESDREMADILDADELDEENARAVFKKQEALREEMMILEMKMNNEIKKVLSSEQLELLKHPMGGRPERPFPPPGK